MKMAAKEIGKMKILVMKTELLHGENIVLFYYLGPESLC